MLNNDLLKRLFGSTYSHRTDLVILNSEIYEYTPEILAAKLETINAEDPSPNLYFHKISDKYVSPGVREQFGKCTFTTLGIDHVGKNVLIKLLNSLPETVTTIGIDNLTASAFRYIQLFFKTKLTRKITIICGKNMSSECEKLLQDYNNSALNPLKAPNVKKRKRTNAVDIQVDGIEKVDALADKNKTQRPSEVLVELTVQNKRLAEELKNAPSPSYVAKLEKKDKRNTERLKELNDELRQAKNKIQELEKISQDLQSELQQEKDKFLELEKLSQKEKEVVDANSPLTLPPATDYDLIPELLDADAANSMLGYVSPKHGSLSDESSASAYGLFFNSMFSSSTKLQRSQTSPESTHQQSEEHGSKDNRYNF